MTLTLACGVNMIFPGMFSLQDAACVGIIGAADGPTAIFMAGKGEPCGTFSSLYFEPGKPVEWRMRFYEKRVEDLEVKLL